jgi:hypothetical protein
VPGQSSFARTVSGRTMDGQMKYQILDNDACRPSQEAWLLVQQVGDCEFG